MQFIGSELTVAFSTTVTEFFTDVENLKFERSKFMFDIYYYFKKIEKNL